MECGVPVVLQSRGSGGTKPEGQTVDPGKLLGVDSRDVCRTGPPSTAYGPVTTLG